MYMNIQDNISKQIALHLQKETQENKRDSRYIRASSIGQCSRRLGYSVLGYQPALSDGHHLFTLLQGTAIHQSLQLLLVELGWIKAKPIWKGDQLEWEQLDDPLSGCELDIIDHDLRILGHLDGVTVPLSIVDNKLVPDSDGERYLIEIKTITDREYFWIMAIRDGGTYKIREKDKPSEFLKPDLTKSSSGKMQRALGAYSHSRKVVTKIGEREYPVHKIKFDGKEELVTVIKIGNTAGQWTNLSCPKEEHIQQASLYANYFGINKILFLYLGKDVDPRIYDSEEPLLNFPLKAFIHEVDPLDIFLIEDKIRNGVYAYTDNGELPDRNHQSPEEDECGFCQYSFQCWKTKDISGLNTRLKFLGLKEISLEPGVIHNPSKNLEEEYSKKKPT